MKFHQFRLVLIVLIAGLIGYGIGVTKVNVEWKSYKPVISVVNKEPPSSLYNVDLSQFWSVWDKINSMYYDKKALDPQKMLNGAITGLVSSVGDPYTMYLPPVQNNNFQEQLAGKFEGIGAELGTKDKQVIVIAPLAGSPAEKAGIKAGDIIAKVDGKVIDGMNLTDVVDKIRGPKGTQVVLSVLHKGAKDLTDITITRDTITVKSVDGWVKKISDIDVIKSCHPTPSVIPSVVEGSSQNSNGIPDQVGNDKCSDKIMYIRLSQFGDGTNQDWTALVNKLLPQTKDVKGMILDLRNNPGGYLTDAQFIAGEFLPEGKVVVTQDAGNGDTTDLAVDRQGALLTMPLVILINGGSASASEIVAGAMQDYKRATLVGEQSFGKGTIQQALDLGQGAGLHVTIAKWLTPTGRWIHGKGLTPDVVVPLDPKDPSHDTQLEKAIEQLVK